MTPVEKKNVPSAPKSQGGQIVVLSSKRLFIGWASHVDYQFRRVWGIEHSTMSSWSPHAMGRVSQQLWLVGRTNTEKKRESNPKLRLEPLPRKRTSFPHKLCTVGSCMSYFEEKCFETSPLATYPEKEEVCRLNSLRSFDLGEIFRHLSEKYRSVKSSAGLPLCILTPGFCPLAPHMKFHGPTS